MKTCTPRTISIFDAYWNQLKERREKEGTDISTQIKLALERSGFVVPIKNEEENHEPES